MTWQWRTIIPVWVLAIVGAVLVALFSPGREYFTWLPIVLAACVLLTFVIQLAVERIEGFVWRVMLSVAGSVVFLAVATGILWLVA